MPIAEAKLLKKLDWLNLLERYSTLTIEKAATQAFIQHPSFPPKLGEFIALCEQVSEQARFTEFDPKKSIEHKRGMSPESKKIWDEMRCKINRKLA